MSFLVSAASASLKNNAKQQTNRGSANYHPSIWGNHFLSYASDSMETDDNTKLLEMKEEIKRMLMLSDVKKPAEKLNLVDAIQRLGVSYHFQSEIDGILHKVYQALQASDSKDDNDDDLYSVSLQFRLLRQHGYYISCDAFSKFRDSGKFKESLPHDVRGILSLYEATHLRTHGENVLDEALAFTNSNLKSIVTKLSTPLLEKQVKHALARPLRKSLPRVEARYYMSMYQQDPQHDEVLLTFAKLDFNILQKLHQKELSDITRWWKDLDFANKLPFARDRLVECYFWILGVYFEPEYKLARRFLTKVISVTSIIDDIYDVYGTIEELELFTSAIERWDVSAIDELPEYMKLCYGALLDVHSEIEKDLAQQGKQYRLHYAKEVMKSLVKNYFYEAKWCHQKYVPTYEEYMKVALVTSAYTMLATTSFVGMGDIVTKESFEWAASNPKIVEASSIICRLMDDLAGYKFEQKRVHVASAIDCYMKQHGISEGEAVEVLLKQVEDSWKVMNEELLRSTAVPVPLLDRVLNLARVIDLLYDSKGGDHYTHSYLIKDQVALLLKEPVPL